jgi:uncharacterized oligopeptide transporter (OPT) family protein
MAVLRAFRTATIWENMTSSRPMASVGGARCRSVIFVLPGLVMIGWWLHVSLLPTFGGHAAFWAAYWA